MSAAAFRVWDAAVPAELDAWTEEWAAWPGREVFAHPAYGALFAQPGDRVLCAFWEEDGARVLHPVLLRDLGQAPYASGIGRPAADLTSPYGYGGPYSRGTEGHAGAGPRFWERFSGWAREAGVVAEFVRFPLFDGLQDSYPGERVERLQNVVRDLAPEPEAMWADFEHKVRKNVNKARRSGVVVEADPTGERLDDFLRIYQGTMERRQADAGYFFPAEFFRRINETLPGQFCYFHALAEGRVVSTELVLVSAENVYSFLGGTSADAFDLRPNDLLKFEVMQWARREGKRRFVLGGGYQPGDGIFRYKLSFAPGGTVPFHTGTRVVRPDVYEALVEARAADPEWAPRPGFFPAYRS